MNDIISLENNEECFTPFPLWEYFQENRDHTKILSDKSRITMDNDCGQACDQPSTPTGRILETRKLPPTEARIFTADQVGTVPSNSLNTHKNGDDHVTCSEMFAVQSTNKVVSPTHRPPLPPGNIPGTHFC
jgi:hypothetical protein